MMTSAVFDASIPMAGIEPSEVEATVDRLRTEMAGAGITQGVLVADQRGRQSHPDAVRADWDQIRTVANRHPTVFSASIGIDPTSALGASRSLEGAASEGAVAAHAVPHAFGLAPDDAAWYPHYAACTDLGIPIMIELGIRRSLGTRVRSVGRPICLDAVACDFPDLTIIAIGSWPWVEEAISMSYKHEQVYLALGGDDPGHDHPSLVRYARSWGRHKVVFASSGVQPAAAMARASAIPLDDTTIASLGQRGRDLILGRTGGPVAERLSAIRND